MPGNEEILRYTEEQLQRIAEGEKPELHQDWSARKMREHDARVRKTRLEGEVETKKFKKRVYSLIFKYFRPELGTEGEIVEWNHKLSGRGFSRVTLKKAVEDLNLQNDSNIFFTAPRVDATDEELLLTILSQNLPSKTFHVNVERRGGYIATLPLKIRRMEKE